MQAAEQGGRKGVLGQPAHEQGRLARSRRAEGSVRRAFLSPQGYRMPGHWLRGLMGVQSGHQEREKSWETRRATGQPRTLVGGTGQCEGSAGLFQNGGSK